ncbi:hypothetical protein [Nocardioides humi]|nr:hypothetical protein [Nocardioides humi]
MGLLDRLIGAANRAEQAKTSAELHVFRDRRFERAEELAATGSTGEAVVTGIRRRLNDGTTETQVRLEWRAPEARAGALRFGDDLAPVIRLGATVRVRTDGDTVALDVAAMAGRLGGWTDPGRRSRKVPEQGVDDRSLDARVLSRLRKWPAETAVVVSVEQARVLGMPSQDWDVVVQRADGARATIHRDHVPPYVRWYVHPGAEIPVAIDPKDATRAQGDWPRLAEERAVDGGRWGDPPPEGSLAAG